MYYEKYHVEWYQGDIVLDFPIVVTDLTDNNRSRSIKLFNRPVIVISQTCDLQRRPFIQVCPIFDFDHLVGELMGAGKSEKGAQSVVESVRNRTVNYYYYLPENKMAGLKEGYANLNFISTVPRAQLLKLDRVSGLTDYARQLLAYASGNFFLRPH